MNIYLTAAYKLKYINISTLSTPAVLNLFFMFYPFNTRLLLSLPLFGEQLPNLPQKFLISRKRINYFGILSLLDIESGKIKKVYLA